MTESHAPVRGEPKPRGPATGASASLTEAPLSGPQRAAALDQKLRSLNTLKDRLRAIAAEIPGRVTFSSSLGIEDQAVLNGIAKTGVPIDVFTLDTGRHFPETFETLEASQQTYGLDIRVMFPDARDVEELVSRDGIMGFRQSIEARKACCHVRKVLPLNRALAGAAGWVTGLRREQSSERAEVPFASWDAEHNLIKINPIADWSLEHLEGYIAKNAVPINPLHAKGFPSIGCQPCTRAIKPGEDIRAGRWWWENEDGKECGLHNRPANKGAAA
jgi:phosphoadenosine phosphosulfate reductase